MELDGNGNAEISPSHITGRALWVVLWLAGPRGLNGPHVEPPDGLRESECCSVQWVVCCSPLLTETGGIISRPH